MVQFIILRVGSIVHTNLFSNETIFTDGEKKVESVSMYRELSDPKNGWFFPSKMSVIQCYISYILYNSIKHDLNQLLN